jgi:hypothetical protein
MIVTALRVLRITSGKTEESTYSLRLPPSLHNSRPPAILLYSLDIVPKSHRETRQAQKPEYYAEGSSHSQFELCWLRFQVEGYDYSNAHNGHIYAEAKVREKG